MRKAVLTMRVNRLSLIFSIVLFVILMTGCNNTSSEMFLPTQEEYPFDRVIIKAEWGGHDILGNLEMWEYVNEDTLLIRTTDGKTYMTDKTNVVFITDNK